MSFVWAPKAQQIWLVGEFNDWQEEFANEVGEIMVFGVWWRQMPNMDKCTNLKSNNMIGRIVYKIDPFAFRFEERPNDASIIYDIPEYKMA